GAELIGMLRRIIGEEKYREGMDLYFDRHDGQAVTIEDFYKCFEDVTGEDFSQFRLWYAQAGTPEITVTENWNAASRELEITIAQKTAPTPGQPDKQPVPVPLEMALIDGQGNLAEWMTVLEDEDVTITMELPENVPDKPLLSVNRDFTAPVRVARNMSRDERLALVRLETDPFNQWDGVQSLVKEEILTLAEGSQTEPDDALVSALAEAVERAASDPAFAALLTRLPDVGELFLERQPADAVALNSARKKLQSALAGKLSGFIAETLGKPTPTPYDPGAEQAGIRALRTALIVLLGVTQDPSAPATLEALYSGATNMTERLAALRALCVQGGGVEAGALAKFEVEWKSNPLVMDKWFAVRASTGTAETVATLAAHPDFDLRNPNRVRSVVATFAMQNLAAFHAPDGSGYRAVESIILSADKANPALGARLLIAFDQWKILEPRARAEAEATLKRLQSAGLSPNSADIVARALG
ncbi:MAG: DUF3458 domain-containing protein, partial [Hyphomonas sp.]|nr:DUF3458 domain-containing protein [Hyphomonas sp.]